MRSPESGRRRNHLERADGAEGCDGRSNHHLLLRVLQRRRDQAARAKIVRVDGKNRIVEAAAKHHESSQADTLRIAAEVHGRRSHGQGNRARLFLRIGQVEPKVKAYVTTQKEQAMVDAAALDDSLKGWRKTQPMMGMPWRSRTTCAPRRHDHLQLTDAPELCSAL